MEIYEQEKIILETAKALLAKQESELQPSVLLEAYGQLVASYEKMLSDVKFITKISDRLQNRLNNINESLVDQAMKLETAQQVITRQNQELKNEKEKLELNVLERTKELSQAYEDLLVLNKELDNFVYRASHDLRGPIARIKGLCMVGMIDVKDAKGLEYLNMLNSNAVQMDNILERLLAVNKLKNFDPAFGWYLIANLLEAARKTASTVMGYDQIKVSFDFDSRLHLFTDQPFFEMLISNLLEYAIKNSVDYRTSVEPFINLRIITQETHLQGFMTYNGQMIPPNLFKQIFHLFQRTSNHPEHSGMELYASNLAAEKLGGKVEVLTSSKEETVFSFNFPNMQMKVVPD